MEDQAGMIIMRIFFSICALGSLFCVFRANLVARWTYAARKKAWNLKENSIPLFEKIGRIWNIIMFFIFLFLILFSSKIM